MRAALPAIAGLAVAAVGIAVIVVVIGGRGETSFVDLEPGHCFDLPTPDEDAATIDLLTVDLIDCDDPHDAEVVAVGELRGDGAEYPGFEAADADAAAACTRVGVTADGVGVVPIAPTEDTWNTYDGRFVCIALAGGGAPLVGSVLDASQLDG